MMDTPIRQRRFYGKLNQNNESSQNFKAEPKLPQIETVHLTTFEELHGVGCVFNPCFRSENPHHGRIFLGLYLPFS